MDTSFPDVLDDNQSVVEYLEVVANGKGKTSRARRYVEPIARRYIDRHQRVLFEIQSARRLPEALTTGEFIICLIRFHLSFIQY